MKILFIGARLFDEVAIYAQSEGIETILSESDPHSPNLKLADEYHIVPRGMDHPMDIALSEDVDAVVPLIGIDKPLREVAAMKEKLEKEYQLPVVASGMKATEISTDKIKTKEFLIKNKMDPPGFKEISKNQYNIFRSMIKYPTVLKQTEGQGGVGVKVALSEDDVNSYFETFSHAMVEDFIGGAEISVEVLRWNKKSVPLVGVYKGETTLEGTHPIEKTRTAPVNIASLNNQELLKIAKKITDDLDANGTTEVEFIFNSQTKKINTLEMNTRPSGTRFLTYSSSNINPLHQLVNMALGEWKPHKIEKDIKEYSALEIPLTEKDRQNISRIALKNEKKYQLKQTFSNEKPWIIHGPEVASRITFRDRNITRCFEIAKKLGITL